MGERTGLPPARHAPIDQLRIAFEHDIRPQPVAFHHAGTIPLDQAIGLLEQLEGRFHVGRILEVQANGAAPPSHHVCRPAGATIALAIDAHNVSSEV